MAVYGKDALEIAKEIDGRRVLEERTIYHDENYTIIVDADGVSNRRYGMDPYIKVYDKGSVASATRMARIAIKDNTYIHHNGKQVDWIIKGNDIKNLNKILAKKSTYRDYKNDTVWEAIKKEIKHSSKGDVTKDIDSLEPIDFKKTKDRKK